MLAWGWHPTFALYWLKCIMSMLATDVEPIFYQRWLNRNKKKVFLANWKAISKRKWPRIITQSWKNSRKLTSTIITAFAKMLEKHWQHWQSVGKFAYVLPTLPTDGQHWPDLACLLGGHFSHIFWLLVCKFLFITSADLCFRDMKRFRLKTDLFFWNHQNSATHLDIVMKSIHDTGINCFSDKRVVQCRRYRGGLGGPCPPNDCLCPPISVDSKSFLEHHVPTTQQTTIEKEMITFRDNSRMKFSRFFAKLLATNCCTWMWRNNPSYLYAFTE